MLPFTDMAKRKEIAVLVMNPNYNRDPETGIPIPHSQTSVEHAIFVWKTFVVNSGF
jgi:hypothetical protein